MNRKLFFILLGVAILLIGGYVFVRFFLKNSGSETSHKVQVVDTLGGKKVSALDLRPLFIEKMQQVLLKSSNGLYKLSVGDLNVDVLASTVSLQNVTVLPDAQALASLKINNLLPQNVLSCSFENLVIEGINLDDAMNSKSMSYKLVKLVHPVITIEQQTTKQKKESDSSFSQSFLKEMEKLGIEKLVVTNGTFIIKDESGGSKKIKNVQVVMNHILLDSATRLDKNRFLFAKQARIELQDVSTKTKDGLYNFKVGNVTIHEPAKRVELKNVSFKSPLSRQQFEKQHKYAKEMYRFSFPSVYINGVDWWTAINKKNVVANKLLVSSGKLSVYFNRSKPLTSRMGKFPNQLLIKLPFDLNIASIQIKNLDIAYEEFNPISKQTGTLYFDNASINISNVSNQNTKPVTINSSAVFMHKVPIKASFTLSMKHAKDGVFSTNITADKDFDASLLNTIAKPLGMMEIEKGTIKKLNTTIHGNQYHASGDVLLLYNNLKLVLLEKDAGKKELDKKDVTSFLANLFVLKNDNPKNDKEAPRKENASFKRDPQAGFFALIWKTLLTGILKTIGAPEKIAEKKSVPQ